MKSQALIATILFTCLVVDAHVAGAEEEGFVPLFNGQDLDGWVAVNTAPSTWSIKDGMLVCTGKPIGEIRTTKMYQNYILELEWRHMKPRGNAGVFVWADDITARGVPFHRGIEVQVLENAYGNTRSHTTHGDIFPIHGATMKPVNGRGGSRAFPTENRSNPSPEWNHYRITCQDGDISLAVNGKVVTRGTECVPRRGYICLESEGGVVHYRNVNIKVLPDSPVLTDHVAVANRDFRSVYDGIGFNGWQVEGKGWQAQDWVLAHKGSTEGSLTSTESYGNVGFVFDIKLGEENATASYDLRGAKIVVDPADPQFAKHLRVNRGWNRFEGELRGNQLTLTLNGEQLLHQVPTAATEQGRLKITTATPVNFCNLFLRQLK